MGLPIFRRFIRNILQALHQDSKEFLDSVVDFASIKGQLFYEQQGMICDANLERDEKIMALDDAGFCTRNIFNVSLTPQEKNCLRLYLEYNTVKQVAKYMNLSPKTVFGYFDNIRDKLGCSYKDDLLKNVEVLSCLGVL